MGVCRGAWHTSSIHSAVPERRSTRAQRKLQYILAIYLIDQLTSYIAIKANSNGSAQSSERIECNTSTAAMAARFGTETTPTAAQLCARHAAAVERIARELAVLAGAAPDVPQLAEMLQLSTTLLALQQPGAAVLAHRVVAQDVQQHLPQQPGKVASEIVVAPFDALPLGIMEMVLLHCDARSLGRMSCASRFFGGGQQRSLVERVASSPARQSAALTPVLRPHEVLSRTLQLWRLENPVAMEVQMLRELAERHRDAPGRRDEAARLYRRALKAEPDHADTLFYFASLLSREPHGCEEAIALLHRALVVEPNDVYVLNSLANLLSDGSAAGRREAEALLRRALVLDPDHVNSVLILALLLSEEPSTLEEAEALYRRALTVEPETMRVMVNLALLLEKQLGGREEAEALNRRALVVDPDNFYVLNNLAVLLSKEPSGHEEAEALCRRALVLAPDDLDVLDALGYLLAKDPERLAEAEQLLRRTLEIDPHYCWALGDLGVVVSARGGAGALAEALQLCERAAGAAAEKDAHAHASATLGIVLLRGGDTAAARQKLADARRLDASCVLAADLDLLLQRHEA